MTLPRSAILTYHSLDDSGSIISVTPACFRRQMEFLAASAVPVVPLEEALGRRNCIAITFDDGFRSFLDYAVPILDQLRLAATVFVVSGYCGGRNNWPTQPAGVVDLPLMAWRDLTSLPPGISVGAHTVTHPLLTKLGPTECEREFRDCQDQIEQKIGKPVRSLAYPYGASSPRVMAAAARHFDLAAGTSLGFLGQRSNPFDLPRIDAYYLRGRFTLESLFRPLGNSYIGFRGLLRSARCALSA